MFLIIIKANSPLSMSLSCYNVIDHNILYIELGIPDEMPRAVMSSAMPPCMRNLLGLLQTSKHISHMGRFAMAAFLLNIGTNEEDLLKMFKSFTDFDERIARYQVEHIAGKRGSRRQYTAPNCSTMRTHGLCVNPDELCGSIKHPLSYYRRKARSLLRQERGRAPRVKARS